MSTSPSPGIPFFTLRTEPDGQQCDAWPEHTLLDSMEQGGIAWPSSCRSGNCRTCIAQLAQGQVRYRMEWPGLTPEEHASGCVLPCVAYPTSDLVLEVPSI
ncbi:MAG: 2Fe-2S iron-sulfur cluster binding domain-containing protein [Burkholderiales bacterium]|uniref:2Fe-2S iron-sulfur cluster-binding protein n=1 Tax=Comamonas granuli TaxID=290309 RepID=UPI0005A7A1C8|nr:2Fe-2S iron-sulfur cluster binding domain-containing protein [Comamonas granuli]MCZ2405405.1 2Fe-2S iron-sulfur cluster binding domain-containing protein [Burkholderiales bacterium]